MKRVLLNVALCVSVLLLPVYLSLIIVVASVFLCDFFVEAIWWAFVLDTLSGAHIFGSSIPYLFTGSVAVLFAIATRTRRSVRPFAGI